MCGTVYCTVPGRVEYADDCSDPLEYTCPYTLDHTYHTCAKKKMWHIFIKKNIWLNISVINKTSLLCNMYPQTPWILVIQVLICFYCNIVRKNPSKHEAKSMEIIFSFSLHCMMFCNMVSQSFVDSRVEVAVPIRTLLVTLNIQSLHSL